MVREFYFGFFPLLICLHRWGKDLLTSASPALSSLLLLWLLAIYVATSLQYYYGIVPQVNRVCMWQLAIYGHFSAELLWHCIPGKLGLATSICITCIICGNVQPGAFTFSLLLSQQGLRGEPGDAVSDDLTSASVCEGEHGSAG
jgi:hypothetical protein